MDAVAKLRGELEDALRRAENDFIRADYAESTAKMTAEKEDATRRIKHYKARLAELKDEDAF